MENGHCTDKEIADLAGCSEWEIRAARERGIVQVGVYLFSDIVNRGFGDKDDSNIIVDSFARCHRTLQQSMIRILAKAIKKMAELYTEDPSRYSDARNESAMKWMVKVSKIDDEYFPFI